MYESLEVRTVDGGRDPGVAGRRWMSERLGVSVPALDRARRELLAPGEGGPWLSRHIRGRKKTATHTVLRRPRESGGAYVAVPAWTLERIAGPVRSASTPAGLAEAASVSPAGWRFYAVLCDRVPEGRRKELTLTKLGEWIGASADTAARRLVELERAGWVEVVHSPGNWLTIRVVRDDAQAAEVAAAFLLQGRSTQRQRPLDPPQIRTLTHRRSDDSPTADSSTPQETPVEEAPLEEAPVHPAAGADPQEVDAPAVAASRPMDQHSARTGPPPDEGQAVRVSPTEVARLYWTLPAVLASRIPAHGARRVQGAIRTELLRGTRTAAELADRIGRRWTGGRWDQADIVDPTAVAITLVRLARIPCANVRCEDGTDLDTGQPCAACATRPRLQAPINCSPPNQDTSPTTTAPTPPPIRDLLQELRARSDMPEGTEDTPGLAIFRAARAQLFTK
ncbi:hypothetical protein ACWENQ_45625 [Nonomuraea sp. NPDC004354]